jgi:hypothetical protein
MPSIALLPTDVPPSPHVVDNPHHRRLGLKVKRSMGPYPEEMKRKRRRRHIAHGSPERSKYPIKRPSTPSPHTKVTRTPLPESREPWDFMSTNSQEFEQLKNVELWEIEHSWTSVHKLLHGNYPIYSGGITLDDILFESPPEYIPPTLSSVATVPSDEGSVGETGQTSNQRISSNDTYMWGDPGIPNVSSNAHNRVPNPWGMNDPPETEIPKTTNGPTLRLALGEQTQNSRERKQMERRVSRFWVAKPIERRVKQTVNSPPLKLINFKTRYYCEMPFSNDFVWFDGSQNLDLTVLPLEDIARKTAPSNETDDSTYPYVDPNCIDTTTLTLHEGEPPRKEYLPRLLC